MSRSPRFPGLHRVDQPDVDRRRERHVVGDVHALAPAAPGANLLGRRVERLGSLLFVAPPVEPERGLEQRHGARAASSGPAFFRSGWPGCSSAVGDRAGVGEDGALDVLERESAGRTRFA